MGLSVEVVVTGEPGDRSTLVRGGEVAPAVGSRRSILAGPGAGAG
ncbi:hypothetical protein [Pseudonocardia terrae]|nr:hypothetical protein [Pseudonocardia terrae]